MASNPITWNVNSRKKQLMPEHVGYNLADCDLIIGPTLVRAHWFCLALEPRTMNFYVLDSLVENVFSKKGKKASAKGKEMTFVVKACVSALFSPYIYITVMTVMANLCICLLCRETGFMISLS